MRRVRALLVRIWTALYWNRAERDFDEELQAHLEMHIEDGVRSGLAPAEARRQALIRLGGVDALKESCREQRGLPLFETLAQDVRYGLRQLRHSPAFTAVAVLTLALGIGANAAIFSVVNSVLLQRLPIRDAGRLVVIWVSNVQHGWSRVGPDGIDYLDWKEQSKSFDDTFLFEHGTGTITGAGEPEQVAGLRVTTNFCEFSDIKPMLGRCFRSEESEGTHNVLLLSHDYWQRRFASNAGVVGQAITLNAESYTVIGVLPQQWFRLFPNDVVVPWSNERLRRADSNLGVFGRLRRDVRLEQATAEMNMIAERIGRERPRRKGWGITMVPLQDAMVEYIRPALRVLLGAVAFVLLIACANVANLLLARALARRKEIAVRVALGAGRARLIRQALVESALLALAGGAAGLLLAFWGLRALMSVLPARVPTPNAAAEVLLPRIHLDWTVVLFTLLISLLTGAIFGLIPALKSTRSDTNESLKERGDDLLAGRQGRRTRSALVVAEAAIAFVLVIGAGLMIRSFLRLLESNPGFNPDHLLTLRIKLPADAASSPYREPRRRAPVFQRFLTRVEELPGIRSAALTTIIPLSQDDMDMGFFVTTEQPPPPGERFSADFRVVSPGYFATLGIPLFRGRAFTDHDNLDGARVVIIDEKLARRFFPNQDPIGKHVQIPNVMGVPREIVGIVGGVRDTGFDQQPRPTIYIPYLQSGEQTMSLLVRTNSKPEAVLPAVKNAIWSVDKDQPVFDIRTMDEIIGAVVSAPRLAFILLGIFAVVALVLAAIGLYGVVAYSVAQRSHEIGVRMALGASREDVLKLVVGRGFKLALAGVALGIAAALALTRFLASLLYGVKPTDGLTFVVVSLLLGGAALLASYIPARRAAKLDPLAALRCE